MPSRARPRTARRRSRPGPAGARRPRHLIAGRRPSSGAAGGPGDVEVARLLDPANVQGQRPTCAAPSPEPRSARRARSRARRRTGIARRSVRSRSVTSRAAESTIAYRPPACPAVRRGDRTEHFVILASEPAGRGSAVCTPGATPRDLGTIRDRVDAIRSELRPERVLRGRNPMTIRSLTAIVLGMAIIACESPDTGRMEGQDEGRGDIAGQPGNRDGAKSRPAAGRGGTQARVRPRRPAPGPAGRPARRAPRRPAAAAAAPPWRRPAPRCSTRPSANAQPADHFVAYVHGTKANPKVMGAVHFRPSGQGVEVQADIQGLPAGTHTYQVSTYGDCSAPERDSAGPPLDFSALASAMGTAGGTAGGGSSGMNTPGGATGGGTAPGGGGGPTGGGAAGGGHHRRRHYRRDRRRPDGRRHRRRPDPRQHHRRRRHHRLGGQEPDRRRSPGRDPHREGWHPHRHDRRARDHRGDRHDHPRRGGHHDRRHHHRRPRPAGDRRHQRRRPRIRTTAIRRTSARSRPAPW